MAPRHVGIGSDFDGVPRGQETIPEGVAGLRRLVEALADRGVNDQTLGRILSGNLLELLESMEV